MGSNELLPTATQILLPEYPREVPNALEAKRMARNATENRAKLIARAEEFGLDASFLARQNEFVVGPFVSPAPLSTTFAGSTEHLNISLQAGKNLVEGLNENGYNATQSAVVLLAMTEVPTKGGQEAMDILVLPKNPTENKRAPLMDKPRKGTVYGAATTSTETVQKAIKMAQASFGAYLDRKEVPKYEKKSKDGIIGAITEDIEAAMVTARETGSITEDQVYYFAFANALNERMLKRVQPEATLPPVYVDRDIYDPFLRYGISDIATFTQKMQSIGLFEDDPGFIKFVDNGRSRVLRVQTIEQDDVVLQFVDSNETISFSDLKSTRKLLAPCKELSYVATQGTFVPVIYGSQNSGEYYRPYSFTRQRLNRIGLSPVLYRTQPQIVDGYQGIGTIMDFYEEVVPQR